MPWRVSARMAASWVSRIPGIEAAADISCFVLGLADELGELVLDAGGRHQLLEVLQPPAALATERDRVRLASVQTINQGLRAVRRLGEVTVAASRRSVVFANRHVSKSP